MSELVNIASVAKWSSALRVSGANERSKQPSGPLKTRLSATRNMPLSIGEVRWVVLELGPGP